MRILDHYGIDPAGMNAAVVGRSFLVGKPMAAMLSNRNATVTLCHSRTVGLTGILREADLVVAAVGKPGFISADMVKPGAVLIDVGINHIDKEADFDKFCPRSPVRGVQEEGLGHHRRHPLPGLRQGRPLHAGAGRGRAADGDHADAQHRRAMQKAIS